MYCHEELSDTIMSNNATRRHEIKTRSFVKSGKVCNFVVAKR